MRLQNPHLPLIHSTPTATMTTPHPASATEIDERLRRRYLDRLELRVKRLRKLLVERAWEELRLECCQISHSAESFGFSSLTALAFVAQSAIPAGRILKAATPLHAKATTETLIACIDQILIEYKASPV